ncbi:hypothetical protein IMSAG013_01128 [Clostridiales bacterium]|nr:hypothetical protein IMSAG013_01128 [Clostridiales bacterium]
MVNVDKIKSLANEQGIKLGFVCNQLGLTESFFRNVKKGKTKISDDRLITIAEILNTTPEYLRDETDQKEKPTETDGLEEGTILLALRDGGVKKRKLTSEQMELIEKMIEQMPEANEDL